MQDKLIVGAAIGDCVHVAGTVNFLNLAETLGYQTVCLGPAVSVEALLAAVEAHDPALVAVGYRLTPETCQRLLGDLSVQVRARGHAHRTWLFGGTEPCVEVAHQTGLFAVTFASGASPAQAIAFLRGGGSGVTAVAAPPPQTLVERILWKRPYPLIRHHFGQPTVAATVAGVAEIARAECLDVLSLGTDQNAQEHFFRPREMDPDEHGAGGVPVRTPGDLSEIYAHTRLGNYPLVRCYSGTRDTLRWATLLADTIHNAWCAIPLFWYTQLDGRSQRSLLQAIPETHRLMHWHARRRIPVEMNESHHWSLREAPDVVAVVAAYLAACNARTAGVRDYVQQLMFNNPPNTSPAMDLGKMLAKLELVESLQDEGFRVWRQTRGGLTSYPPEPAVAKGHLAATIYLQMQLKPHILHVVGHTEAHHATGAAELIEACRIADGTIRQCLLGVPDMTRDPAVQKRRADLVHDARLLLAAIRDIAPPGPRDPFTSAEVLARAVETGLLDAPHLRGNAAGCGRVVTRIVAGACVAIDRETGRPLPEAERIDRIHDAARPRPVQEVGR